MLKQQGYWLTWGLLLAYLLQDWFNWHWQWLAKLQQNDLYLIITGLLLAVMLSAQWMLALARTLGKMQDAKQLYSLHIYTGFLTPIFLYIHSVSLGFGYLWVFSSIVISNIILGLLNKDFVRYKSKILSQLWMLLHVCFAVLIIVLLYFHAAIVLLW
jgi:methionine sulfoxide reductase heme-binding subunit